MKSVLIALFFLSLTVQAEITVVDDAGNTLIFSQPVKRIVSLAPHATELLFAAGATKQITGTVSYSDYPEAAKKIPRIGSYNKFDLESIIAMSPDLIFAWQDGNPEEQLNKMREMGFNIFISEPRKFKDVAENIRSMGKLLGTEKVAEQKAKAFLTELDNLKHQYQPRKLVNIFYQVWNEPLITIGSGHLVGQVIKFCGGRNVFGDLSVISPRVSIEAVMEKNPDVIVAGMALGREDWIEQWQKWKGLKAVKNKHVYAIDADLIVRQTPRVLKGTRLMCEYLDRVRNKK